MTLFSQSDFLFVGLGNPGPAYDMTRHNIGSLVVKALATRLGWRFKEEKRFEAFAAKGLVDKATLHLLLPTTYMNLSGSAVRRYMDYFKLEVKSLVVIVDDISLPFGLTRLKPKGSAGGHNGLKSVEACLGTSDYSRLRMGIGHPGEKGLADYVLDPFTREELEHLTLFISRGAECLQSLLKEGLSQAMKAINTPPSIELAKKAGEERIEKT